MEALTGIEKDFILSVRRGPVVAPSLDGRSVKRVFSAKRLGEAFVRHSKPSRLGPPRRTCSHIAIELLVYLKG